MGCVRETAVYIYKGIVFSLTQPKDAQLIHDLSIYPISILYLSSFYLYIVYTCIYSHNLHTHNP